MFDTDHQFLLFCYILIPFTVFQICWSNIIEQSSGSHYGSTWRQGEVSGMLRENDHRFHSLNRIERSLQR